MLLCLFLFGLCKLGELDLAETRYLEFALHDYEYVGGALSLVVDKLISCV